MKTLLPLFALLFALQTTGISQSTNSRHLPNRIFKKGQTDIHIGAGLLPTYFMDKAKINMLPVSLEVAHRVGSHFSLGLYAGYSSSESKPILESDGVEQAVVNNHLQLGLKAAVHILKWDNADWYGGFMIGYQHSSKKATNGNMDFMENHMGIHAKTSKPTFTGFVGGRYAINQKWSLFGEAGFGISLLTAGVGYRL